VWCRQGGVRRKGKGGGDADGANGGAVQRRQRKRNIVVRALRKLGKVSTCVCNTSSSSIQ
jgi:hypothetical protein